MKQFFVVTTFLILFVGCNVSENKEARIKKLEMQIEKTVNRIQDFEDRIETLETNARAKED
jgi:cell division protein FtsB